MFQRRDILKFGLGAAAGAGLSAPMLAWGRVPPVEEHIFPADHPLSPLREAEQVASPAVIRPAAPSLVAPVVEFRELALHNLHTDEKLKAVYWENGTYVPDALQAVNKVLRDHRSGEVHAIDRGLLDLLDTLSAKVEARSPFQVISGYRSSTSNAKLRGASKGKQVAENSLHVKGQAIDICIEGCDLQYLNKAALSMAQGGVGYYPVSKFVHVDVGRVRSWKGT
jgi:uncharacterized protein YcbK (DUF882 family)